MNVRLCMHTIAERVGLPQAIADPDAVDPSLISSASQLVLHHRQCPSHLLLPICAEPATRNSQPLALTLPGSTTMRRSLSTSALSRARGGAQHLSPYPAASKNFVADAIIRVASGQKLAALAMA